MSNQKPDIRPQPFFGLPNIKCRIYYLREASIYVSLDELYDSIKTAYQVGDEIFAVVSIARLHRPGSALLIPISFVCNLITPSYVI